MSGPFFPTVCPHDCPSACALEVERLTEATIGRVRGAADQPYTAGLVCAKVARYAERVHHPGRLVTPMRRSGPKGSGVFEAIAWDDALDIVADAFRNTALTFGPESVWPYHYGGTMGLVMRDGIERLRRAGGYSAMGRTICSTIRKSGWMAGIGALWGANALEIAEAELIVFWGGNPAATNIHALSIATRARKEHGAVIVTIDPYRTRTAAVSDVHIPVRPGTDGALACAVMHVLFRDGFFDADYLARYTDCPDRLEAHLQTRTPAWAEVITGIPEGEIVTFAHRYGSTRKSFIRLGTGFSRSRNGAANVHAVTCLPAITGAWRERGGGALGMTGGVFAIDRTLIEGSDIASRPVRTLDMSRIGDILLGDPAALCGGGPVKAMLVQHSNPAVIAPDSVKVRKGLAREDMFLCVHEQFMTETAAMADIVLPATTFLEHDDLYTANGHTYLQIGRRVVAPHGQSRSNHEVLSGLAERLGFDHPAFAMSAWELVDATLKRSGYESAEAVHAARWVDCRKDFRTSHFLDGFNHPDGRFHFAPNWSALGVHHEGLPPLPDHVETTEVADADHPYRLVTAPAQNFLSSTFSVCPGSRSREGRPTALIHPTDCVALGISDGDLVRLGNARGSIVVHARTFDGLQAGVVVVEGLWLNDDFAEGNGINTLIGSDPVGPAGGAAFHDTAVWIKATTL